MKTKLLSLLIAFLMLMVFVPACNDVEQTDETPPVTAQATPDNTPTEAPTAEPTPEATPTPIPKVGLEGVPEYTFTEVLRINVGNGEGEIAYGTEVGPQDFLVREDGSICILDSINRRILIFKDGECTDAISLIGSIGAVFGQLFDYYDGKFYVLDLMNDVIVVVSDPAITGDASYELIDLPNGVIGGDVLSLEVNANGIRMLVRQNIDLRSEVFDCVKPHTANDFTRTPAGISETVKSTTSGVDIVTVQIGEDEWHLVKKPSEGFDILGANSNGNLYIDAHQSVEDTSTSSWHLEKTIRVFDRSGNILGYARVDTENWVSYPLEDTKLMNDGTVYSINCFDRYVSIRTVTFG